MLKSDLAISLYLSLQADTSPKARLRAPRC